MNSDPNFSSLLASIARCDAVYEPDDQIARHRFSQLGSPVLGRSCDAGHQAIAHRDPDGWATLTICGTRVSEGSLREHAVDLFEDVDFSPRDIGNGVQVAAGAIDGLGSVYSWAVALLQDQELIRVEGHSLGGQRTHLAPLFVPISRLDRAIAWEPPKAANDTFYQTYAPAIARTITILNGADPWAAWPWISGGLVHPPGPILWLHNANWSWITRESWPGGEMLSASDHDVSQILLSVQHLSAALPG